MKVPFKVRTMNSKMRTKFLIPITLNKNDRIEEYWQICHYKKCIPVSLSEINNELFMYIAFEDNSSHIGES